MTNSINEKQTDSELREEPAIIIQDKSNTEIARFETNGDVFIKGRKIDVDKELAQLFSVCITEVSGLNADKLKEQIIHKREQQIYAELMEKIEDKIEIKGMDGAWIYYGDIKTIINNIFKH